MNSKENQRIMGKRFLIIGTIIFCVVIFSLTFFCINTIALPEYTVKTAIISKEKTETKNGYTTEIIAGKVKKIPKHRSEEYIVTLKISGALAQCNVSRDAFIRLKEGDIITVSYAIKRITREITNVEHIR